ncbi:hypothetical protein OROMI_012911 [Orobanche minor]
MDLYLLGCILSSVLSLFALYSLIYDGKRNCDVAEKVNQHVDSVNSTDAGEIKSEKLNGDADVIIVGAGVAGAALAHTLGKPDRIVEELLQPGGYLKLVELGLEDCVNNIDAQKVFGYALFKDGKHTRLSYPLEKFHSDVSGRSFHNGRFIQRIPDKAASLPKRVASTINTLAGAFNKVFSASPDQARKVMRQACFDYLSLGGLFSEGPISLLSGLNPRPLSLVLHFFAVAVFGVGRLILPFPSPKRMCIGARFTLCASGIILPIIKAEGIPAYYRTPPALQE